MRPRILAISIGVLPALTEQLIPQLKKLKPGTRIVSHAFMRGSTGEAWPHEKSQEVDGKMIYYCLASSEARQAIELLYQLFCSIEARSLPAGLGAREELE